MKLRDKDSSTKVWVTFADGRRVRVRLTRLLTRRQIRKMGGRPEMAHQFARHVADAIERIRGERPKVQVSTSVSLNGRPAQPLIDPTVDLGSIPYPAPAPAPWILPLDPSLEPGSNHSGGN